MTETAGLGRIEKAGLRNVWPPISRPGSRTMYPNRVPPWYWNSNCNSEKPRSEILTGFVGSRHRNQPRGDHREPNWSRPIMTIWASC